MKKNKIEIFKKIFLILAFTLIIFSVSALIFLLNNSLIFQTKDILKKMILSKSLNPNNLPILTKHKDKKKFEVFLENERQALLILPRYDADLKRSIVEVIDLINFEIIHTYKHNITEMNDKVRNNQRFPSNKLDNSELRFRYLHPLILGDGSLISQSGGSPLFKINLCSELEWINEEEIFSHSIMLDKDNNIWVKGILFPPSKYLEGFSVSDVKDDAIIKLDKNGNINYKKSVIEILIENNILQSNFALYSKNDPIHLNDIEPAKNDSDFWKKGDLFLSLRNMSSIIHYRPSTNKIINYFTGPFAEQHDVDIISDKEISIFNNNNFLTNNSHSEVLVYNFKTKNYHKLFNEQLKNENFKTETEGLSEILIDGSLLVEEGNHGRLILFNKEGKKEWEYINKGLNKKIYITHWARIIEDKVFINKFKSLINKKNCLN